MANKKTANGGKPVTQSVLNTTLNKALKPILDKLIKHDGRFEEIDRRFDVMETRFEMNDRRYIGLNVRTESLEKSVGNLEKAIKDLDEKTERRDDALSRAIAGLEKNMKEQFNKIFNHIDAFMKRTETNERETFFLGQQHDDLAKYCTAKIGYPTYGRNL